MVTSRRREEDGISPTDATRFFSLFAIDARRTRALSARDAILEAALTRFRPITMTTMAAVFGAVPLAIGLGTGSELRQPLGVAIIGGLLIGVGEKLSEIYLGPMLGGGIEIWFAYVLALVFLLVRPQGLFGEKIIDRV